MKNSIEQIWKQGFVDEATNAIPKINNLYNKKSQNIVDKIQRMYGLNVKFLFAASVFAGAMLFAFDWFVLATVIPCLLLWIAFTAQKQLKKLELSVKSDNSYQYIKSFSIWFNQMIVDFTVVYRIFYPTFALAMLLDIRMSAAGEYIITEYLQRYPDTSLLLGTPWLFYLAAIFIIAVVRYFSEAFFLFDLKLMYGRVMKKLDDILSDMEELRL
ncbi:MAG: hypothetical protein ACJAVV_003158 [Alphaproteobacteria bacterium]|jgi:hypothetical protein